MAEERSRERQQGTAGQPPSPPERQPSAQQEQKNPPYALYVVALALGLASIVFVLVMLIFRNAFQDPAVVTTALSTLFGIFGTVVGAYFGIKASNDATDKAQSSIERANETANRALAELPPEVGKRIMRGG